MVRWLWLAVWVTAASANPLPHEVDSEQTRKLLGSSVVTSVSVIMDHGNGTKTYLTDGQPAKRPQVVGTPGTLLAPDRYEFYSFGEDGELVKKLMTLDQIQSLIAGGDELEPLPPVYYPQPLIDSSSHTDGVHKVLESVQNVLKGELQAHEKIRDKIPPVPMPDDSWSILLPGLLNSDLDYKDPHTPIKSDVTPIASISNDLHTTRMPTVGSHQKNPSTTVKYTTPNKPTAQASSTTQYSTMASTTRMPESTTVKKTTMSDMKYSTQHNTPAPFVKTTGHQTVKPQNQKPSLSTTKRPFISTKKPYISESPFSKIPLSNLTKTDQNKIRPVMSEERNPTTKFPETKRPSSANQKPSGIPTITHYLPISSSSSPNATQKTTPTLPESSTMRQKVTSVTKEPTRVNTTKRPSTVASPQTTAQKLVQTTTKKPDKVTSQSKPASTVQKTTTNTYKTVPTKATQKTQRPTTAMPTVVTRNQPKPSTLAHTTVPTTTKEKIDTTTVSMKTEIEKTSPHYQRVNTTIPKPQKLVQNKKPETVKPSSNLVGQGSNIVNIKLKPTTITHPAATESRTPTTPKVNTTPISTTVMPPERITTFSYTSKITSTGEIVTSTPTTSTSQQKLTSEMITSKPTSTTLKNNLTSTKPTEKPLQKITLTHQNLASSQQPPKDQTSTPPSQKPTTYHPQNFNSRKPVTQSSPLISTSPLSKTSTTMQPMKYSTTNPSTSTQNHHSNISTKLPTKTPVTTTQYATKPTTETVPEGTTLIMTTISGGPSSDPVHSESSTFLADEMPLQEIPLKIYESLKDNISGPHNIMTTIMSNNMPTTTSKFESTYTTINSEETTLGSTTPEIEKITTILSNFPGLSTTPPTAQPNETIMHNSTSTESTENTMIITTTDKQSESINNELSKEQLEGSASMPVGQKYNVSTTNNSLTEATTLTTTDSTTNSSDNNSETTTNMDSTTIFKDQMLQERISEVTSILLDQAERQQAIKEAMLASNLYNFTKESDKLRITTENEPTSTTMMDYTEMQTTSQEIDSNQMKSEVRINEDAELPERPTTPKPEMSTQEEKIENTTIKDIMKEQTTENNKQTIKKSEHKQSTVLPTKESKLNPDSDLQLEAIKKKPDTAQTEASIQLRTTAHPEVSTSDRIKIADFEKSAPKPSVPFVKKPNPVYQPLESLQPPAAIELHPAPYESMGLEASIAFLGEDVRRFADLCNELAFRMWTSITGKGQISSRSLIMSPFAVTSLLAMVFLGARGPTSGQMNDVLRLDDMVTFNPHQVLQNVTESVINSKNYGVATAAFVRELYSDKAKGKILDFYKERVQQYYQGHVEEVTFSMIGDIIRRRTNLLVKRQTLGKVPEYLRGSSLNMRPPLAAFSANIFQTDCEQGSTDGRDGEMYFVVRPSTRQRRLVPVPAVVWRSGFLAGYEPSLDATSVCLGAESIVSTILILPGQQGQVAPGDGLARLEQRLIETSYRRGGWSRLLRSLMPRPGLELQIPRFSHRSVLNITGALQRMGLRDLFNTRADLRGLNGLSNDLHLSDMLQVNTFSTCGEETIGARHHVETYPASPQRMGREEPEYYPPKDFENVFGDIPLSLRPRQARLPDNPRLRFDRPFLYMVRHNPSGMILHMGRFNPRLLP